MWKSLVVTVLIGATLIWGQFFECHDDPSYEPEEGPVSELQFTWLGTLQYIHVKNGTPHYFRVPRVILITRQFVISTANDASTVPDGYALGNVVFADYERDEEECSTTPQDVVSQKTACEPAILMMPVADVLLHPEYKNFGAKNSVALMRLVTTIKSTYVVPVCLPLQDFLMKKGRITREQLYHVDFTSDVPRDFIEEEKELSRISLLPRELCHLYDNPHTSLHGMKDRVTCTTGCGFRSGAPSLIHEHTGHWSIVALAEGGCPCPDPLREYRHPVPSSHILLHPYVPWITNAISGQTLGINDKDDPFGFPVLRANRPKGGWVGHWWMGGRRCYDRAYDSYDMYRFYRDVFHVRPANKTFFNYFLIVTADESTTIVCVKVGMPYRLAVPKLSNLDTTEISLEMKLVYTEGDYRFQVEAWGYNDSLASSSSSSSITG